MSKFEPHISSFPTTAGTSKGSLLFVHGAWHGAWCWEGPFMDECRRQGFDCYAVDLRGHGQSAAVRSMRWNSLADYVSDVETALARIPGDPIVIGHSMGGMICQHLACRNPKLKGIALLASAPHFGVWKFLLDLCRHDPKVVLQCFATLSLAPAVRRSDSVHHSFLNPDATPEEVAELHGRLTDESFRVFLDMLFLNLPRRQDTYPPMLVMGGANDILFPPPDQQALADRYSAEYVNAVDSPHNLMMGKCAVKNAGALAEWCLRLS